MKDISVKCLVPGLLVRSTTRIFVEDDSVVWNKMDDGVVVVVGLRTRPTDPQRHRFAQIQWTVTKRTDYHAEELVVGATAWEPWGGERVIWGIVTAVR
jgi:hypothetical protein